MTRNYIQGTFKPVNRRKYKGNADNIIYRSKWEWDVFRGLDVMKNVRVWSSEEIVIPYTLTTPRGAMKIKRYFPDVYVEFIQPDGSIKKCLIEIKPYKETIPPEAKKGKAKKTLLYEVNAWNMNSSKWKAAEAYCRKRGWHFMKWTEREIYPGKTKMNDESKKIGKLGNIGMKKSKT